MHDELHDRAVRPPDRHDELHGRPPGLRDRHVEPLVGPPDPSVPAVEPTVHRDRTPPAIPRSVIEAREEHDRRADSTPVAQVAVVGVRIWRRVLQVGLVVCTLLVGYYLISLYQVWSTGRADQARPVDAIVVMGAAQYDGRPSPQLAARLDHVVELWPDGWAPLVVVTGGNQPGDRFTEAESSANYLVERGIPADAIIAEDEGANTYESLEGVAALLDERGLDSVLIVTDPYHALRSRLIAEEVGLEAYTSATTTSVVTGSDSLGRHLEEAAGVALGRIIGFDRLTGLTG